MIWPFSLFQRKKPKPKYVPWPAPPRRRYSSTSRDSSSSDGDDATTLLAYTAIATAQDVTNESTATGERNIAYGHETRSAPRDDDEERRRHSEWSTPMTNTPAADMPLERPSSHSHDHGSHSHDHSSHDCGGGGGDCGGGGDGGGGGGGGD